MKRSKKLSILPLGTAALTLGSILPIQAQVVKAQTLQNLNLRTGPSTAYSIILTIKKDSVIEVIENKGDWAQVRYNGKVGYVSSQYIKNITSNDKPEDSNNNTTITTMECSGDRVNVRSGPSTTSSVISKLNKGDKVQVVYNTSTGWSKIKVNNGYGYVSAQYLKKPNTDVKPTPDPNPTPETTKTMICSATTLNVRSGPSTSDNLIGTLKKGDKVYVIEQLSNGWSKIKFEGKTAYVSSQYLAKETSPTPIPTPPPTTSTTMKCNADILNVRSGPATSYSVMGKLRKGDKVQVIEALSNGWSKIQFEGKVGYVSTEYLAKEVSTTPPTENTNYMKCNATSLNVRSGPATTYAIIGKFKSGDKVEVIKHLSNGWSEVKINNKNGYVSTMYLTK